MWLEFANAKRSAGMMVILQIRQSEGQALGAAGWAFPIFTTSIWMVSICVNEDFQHFPTVQFQGWFPSPQVVSVFCLGMVGSRPKILTVSLSKMAGVSTPHFPNHFASVGRFIDSQVTVITVIPIPESDKDENNPILISLEIRLPFTTCSKSFCLPNPSHPVLEKKNYGFPWFHPIFPYFP